MHLTLIEHFFATSSVSLWCYLFYKTIRLSELTFINSLLAMQFLGNALLSLMYAPLLFRLRRNFDNQNNEDRSTLCVENYYMWMALYTFGAIPNIGIIFCRFIYARYAHGLLKDKGKLFHKVVLLVISIFSLHWLLVCIIKPIVGLESHSKISKGMICNELPLPGQPEAGFIKFYIKPKLMLVFVASFYTAANVYIVNSSKKQTSRFKIPRQRRSPLTIIQQSTWVHLYAACTQIDQLVVIAGIQMFNSRLGENMSFEIWWYWNLLMFLTINILAPATIIYLAYKDFLEFRGLRGKSFPGQDKPRKMNVQPFRPRVEHWDVYGTRDSIFNASTSEGTNGRWNDNGDKYQQHRLSRICV